MSPTAVGSNTRVLLILAFASALAPVSMDFFAPSMPDATRELGVSAEAVQTTLYIFLIGYALAPVFWGALADRFGRRWVMLVGLATYSLASLGCYQAVEIPELSLMRLLQGMAAACGVVLARTVLRDIHGPKGATKAISGMYLILVWVPISAPILGGYLGTHYSWRIAFLVMAAMAMLIFVGSFFWQKETMPEKSGQSDSLRASWTAILRTPLFVRYAVANMLCVTSMLLFLSNYSYLLQQDFRIGATGSGYVLALFNACIAAGVYLVRYLAPRLGVEHTVRLGLAAAVGGWLVVLASSLVISNPSVSLLAPIALTGLGYGMVISLCAGKAMTPFSQLAGSASALYLFIQSVGSALINLLVSQVLEKSLVQLSSALLVISVLAIICMSLAAPRDSAINT